MDAILFFVVLAALAVWAAFWIIRLAVRYGMNDALRMDRDWIAPERVRDDVAHWLSLFGLGAGSSGSAAYRVDLRERRLM